LSEAGYVDGRNVTIDYRWAEGKYDRLPQLAAELVRQRVAVIATAGGSVSALAAKGATATIPIVFLSGGDLVKLGLVKSLSRPEGNVTGVSQFTLVLLPKRLELLRELAPKVAQVGFLVNPKNPNSELELTHARSASESLGLKLMVVGASSETELDAAFLQFAQQRVGGLLVSTDPFFDGRRVRVVALAERHSIPTIYGAREYAIAGGLISYGSNFADTYREAGAYAGRILKGARPGDLPILQPSKFEMVVNLKTAKALGISIPQSVVVRADEAIQ
jgi:putative ABC transport system substrate-binding protein